MADRLSALAVEVEFARQPSMQRLTLTHSVGSTTYVRNDLLTHGQRRPAIWGWLARLIVRFSK